MANNTLPTLQQILNGGIKNGSSLNVAVAGRQTGKSIMSSIFADEYISRTEEPIAFHADPLAVVLKQRAQSLENHEITSYLISDASKKILVEKEYAELALKIRKYYSKRLMLATLKHNKMSKFRQDLQQFVDDKDRYKTSRNMYPLIVKLPDFYEEDTLMDQFTNEYKMKADDYTDRYLDTVRVELTPITKFKKKTRLDNSVLYWFTDRHNCVYRLHLEPKNPLLHLFEREFAKETVSFECNRIKTSPRGQDYYFYNISGWTVL